MLSKKSSNNLWKSLFIVPIFCGIVTLFSCESYSVKVNPDGTPLVENAADVRIDTITTFDYDTGKESMSIEKVYVNDIVTTIDTVIVFDSDTYEETVQIVKLESPRKEVLLETYTINNLDNETGNMVIETYHKYPQDLVYVTDTITTFNIDTYEEKVSIIKGARAKEELVSTKIIPKDQIKSGQKFDNIFNPDQKIYTKRSSSKE